MSIADKLTTIAENVSKVYEAGKAAGGGVDAGLDLFWETFQRGGGDTESMNCVDMKFGYKRWTDETFKPKYPLVLVGDGSNLFRDSLITNYEALKMVNFSGVTSFNDMFRESKITHLGVFDVTGRAAPYNLYQVFYGGRIESIDKMIVNEKLTFSMNWGGSLKNITFEGVIGNDPYFKNCPNLTYESLMSTIEHLKDYSGTETSKNLGLGETNLAKLTDEEKAIATQKGWTMN